MNWDEALLLGAEKAKKCQTGLNRVRAKVGLFIFAFAFPTINLCTSYLSFYFEAMHRITVISKFSSIWVILYCCPHLLFPQLQAIPWSYDEDINQQQEIMEGVN